MIRDIDGRVLSIAKAMITSRATVRTLAHQYCVSKSTVHKDLSQRLKPLDAELYAQVRAILQANKAERHLRGGQATRLKYSRMRRERTKH
ncbi:MAG: sporulation transcriptional regulator SpoIIID [Candidatus Fimadaptatus sp.]|jgi:putative DeoR family transcriptional regulator (stage III sporulation protein D)